MQLKIHTFCFYLCLLWFPSLSKFTGLPVDKNPFIAKSENIFARRAIGFTTTFSKVNKEYPKKVLKAKKWHSKLIDKKNNKFVLYQQKRKPIRATWSKTKEILYSFPMIKKVQIHGKAIKDSIKLPGKAKVA